MKNTVRLAVLCLLWACTAALSVAQTKAALGGYPIANFALTVNVSPQGEMYGQILHNTGRLGPWLTDRGAVEVGVEKDGSSHPLSAFAAREISRQFPFVEGTYAKSSLIRSRLKIKTFCPLAVNDVDNSALPVIMLQVECHNPKSKAENFSLTLRPNEKLAEGLKRQGGNAFHAVGNGQFLMAADNAVEWNNGQMSIPVSLEGKQTKTLRILIALHDAEWVSTLRFSNPSEVAEYTFLAWNALEQHTRQFSQAIPESGFSEVDTYLRWYLVPAISLTRCNRKGEILTMGYCELNPRDSYWTTWLHLVLYKDAERKMIEECLQAVSPAGKMPTTILPLIERHDDLDINAFLILRIARFYRLYHERENLKRYWPVMKRAMDWLIARDTQGFGLPRQVSFWGDWKDVKGVEDRAYSPFSALIYLTALKDMIQMGTECGDTQAVNRYQAAYDKGYQAVNRSTDQGGMWNGQYYCQLWKDGSVNDKLLQDQTIGILFDVVPHDRALKILEALNSKSRTPYGIAETMPYYPKEFGYEPGTYHNGAVWPWVSWMDCWARIHKGQTADAVELIKAVGHADIVASGDWSANEHINSRTGENLGFHIQGWSAALFGVVYFGMAHPGIIP
ncbi:MAG: hypothetical protein J6L60_10365 [Bacteroidaceae bacterium]|nr:hypothetical protein [Bacteroidaceae bacterium]